MKLVFLGTASSKPSPDRNPSSIALNHANEVILFDCGEGSQRQMLRVIKQSRIKRIFVTHFHGDHYLGIPGLLMTLSLNGRTEPIEIYGPMGTLGFINNLMDSGYVDIGYDVIVRELTCERLEFQGYAIMPFVVDHGVPALGYVFMEDDRRGRFDRKKAKALGIEGRMFSSLEKDGEIYIEGRKVTLEDVTGKRRPGRTITYTGDTRPVTLPKESHGSHILIHEATFLNSEERGDTYHSTVEEACQMADAIGANLLVLTHINSRHEASVIEEMARLHFDKVLVAYDLMEIVI